MLNKFGVGSSEFGEKPLEMVRRENKAKIRTKTKEEGIWMKKGLILKI